MNAMNRTHSEVTRRQWMRQAMRVALAGSACGRIGKTHAWSESQDRLPLAELQTGYRKSRAQFENDWLADQGRTQTPAEAWPLLPSDASRTFFFIPAELAEIHENVKTSAPRAAPSPAQKKFAEQLATLITQADSSVDRGLLYRWTHELVAMDPTHAQARRWLRLPVAAPSRASGRIATRHPRRAHPRFGWRPGEYLTLDTRHYRITTNDSPASARTLAENLETLYSVWQQLFHRLWNSADAPRSKALHQVVLFRSHEEYLAHLKTIEQQAEITRGYYHGPTRTAYFVGGETPSRATWFHEATHQLFQERTATVRQVGVEHNFWIIEGIALYFESFDCQGHRASLGGLESDRLQFARYRALRESAVVPLDAFVSWNQQQWQAHPRIHANYSQAAGITHFLMHAENGRYRQALERLLEQVYTGHDRAELITELTGRTWQELHDAYLDFLRIDDHGLQGLPTYVRPRQLSLGGTRVTDAGFAAVQLDQCEWLDLYGLNVSDASMQRLQSAHRLRQLSLESTRISDTSVSLLSQKAPLVELDLSQTRVTNESLRKLAQFPSLESLWLTGTSVTDEGVEWLNALPRLELLELTDTQTSAAVRQRWEQRRQAPSTAGASSASTPPAP